MSEQIESALRAAVLAVVSALPDTVEVITTIEGGDSITVTAYGAQQPYPGGSKIYTLTLTVQESTAPAVTALERVVVDGERYRIGGGTPALHGFGGSRFEIEFHDGRRVITHDLWHLGPASGDPDTAHFVKPGGEGRG